MLIDKVMHRTYGLTNGRYCGDNLSKLELVQDGGLTSSIETNHQNSHFLLGKNPTKELCKTETHFLSDNQNSQKSQSIKP